VIGPSARDDLFWEGELRALNLAACFSKRGASAQGDPSV